MAIESNRLLIGVALAAFCYALAALCVWVLWDSIAIHREALTSGRHFIAIGGSHGYLPGVLLGLVGLALIITFIVVVSFFRSSIDPVMAQGQQAALIVVLASVAVAFTGRYLVQSHWERRAMEAGYVKCPGTELLLSRASFSSWVKIQDLCYNQQVRQIIMTGSKEESLRLEARIDRRNLQID